MDEHEKWMRRALQLARRGAGGASPNPMVGCVIVRNGRKVGEGWHERFGGAHAEVSAIKSAGVRAKGATLYVNLEPCCHWGKTPPCTESIIPSGISRVVSSIPDPNPLVRNKGFRALKSAGIQVILGVLKEESEDLNRPFRKFVTEKKPYVILKSALSLDGKTATSSGRSRWISSKTSRDFSYRLRTEVDAVMVGAGTVRKDDPELTSHGKGRDPVRVVWTSTGRLPPGAKIFDCKSPTWVFYSGKKSEWNNIKKHVPLPPRGGGLGWGGNRPEWIECGGKKDRISFPDLLKKLASRGISRLLIEGGGETASSAIESGEADEIFFFIAPKLIGGDTAPTPFDGKGFKELSEAIKLKWRKISRIGDDLLVNASIIK